MKKSIYLAAFLGILCAIFGGAISYVNSLTAPIIKQQSMAAEMAVFSELDPEATFEELDISSDTSGLIKKGYYGESASNKYWVYSASVVGFNTGASIDYLIGFNQDGSLVLYNVISQLETDGIGSRVTTDEFSSGVVGSNVNDAISPLSGATVSSNAVISGINAAKTLYGQQAGVSVETKEAEPIKGPSVSLSDDFSDFSAECEVKEASVYTCNAKGYGLVDPDGFAGSSGHDYGRNEVEITLSEDEKTIVSITPITFGDTENIGDKAFTEDFFSTFTDASLESEIDLVSGATWTSKSIASMASKALNGGN